MLIPLNRLGEKAQLPPLRCLPVECNSVFDINDMIKVQIVLMDFGFGIPPVR